MDTKKHVAETGRALGTLPENALDESLDSRDAVAQRQPIRLRTFKGNGVRPGVDLDDSSALLDLVES